MLVARRGQAEPEPGVGLPAAPCAPRPARHGPAQGGRREERHRPRPFQGFQLKWLVYVNEN